MIALVVMCVVACGMWIACATGSRAQQKARQLEERRLIMGLSFAEARRGCLPPGAVTNCGGWRIEAGASDSGSPSNGWRSVTISRTNEPGAEWTVYLKDEGRIAPQ
jgi:hypothetical protein